MYILYTDCIEQERTEACVVQAGSGRLLTDANIDTNTDTNTDY